MSDRPLGMVVAAVLVAPVCLLCFGGPALIAGSFAAWFTGTNALLLIGALIALALLVWRLFSRRKAAGAKPPISRYARQARTPADSGQPPIDGVR